MKLRQVGWYGDWFQFAPPEGASLFDEPSRHQASREIFGTFLSLTGVFGKAESNGSAAIVDRGRNESIIFDNPFR